MKPEIILIAAAIIIIVSVFTYVYLKNKHIIKLGIKGEKKVMKILKPYAAIRGYKVLNDIYLPLYDQTTQVDHILIGYFGLIVIETKNYRGEIYGDPKANDWIHIMGNERHNLYNPLKQNQTHIDCIRHIFSKEKLYNINIESLVVFSGKKIVLNIPKGLPVIKLKKLKSHLKKAEYQKDKDVDVNKIYDTLVKYQVTDSKLISKHNKNVKKIIKSK
ncbi:MAG: nuclease [Oscillospiraceae bacterium]|jgi:hypothetical protein|nr:nuclease [Oscillospiraceae bacterium]